MDLTAGNILTGALGGGLVLLFSLPAFFTHYRRFAATKHEEFSDKDYLYEDQDGQASPESQSAFSTLIPRTITLLAAILGLLVAIANGVLVTTEFAQGATAESWLRAGAWVSSRTSICGLGIRI